MSKENSAASGLIKNLLTDRFSDTWKLLSETSGFLSRTQIFSFYEEELRAWRHDLQTTADGSEEQKRIRQEIIELRRSLRQQGFDLSLAKQNLVLDGFRNDASLGEGFRRVVVFFAGDGLYWLSGDDNHITLADLLEKQISSRYRKHNIAIRSKHYLWYCRKGNTLVLSGSDTETKDDYERLKAMAEANSLGILAGLKYLK
jgi:hypothetical protein